MPGGRVGDRLTRTRGADVRAPREPRLRGVDRDGEGPPRAREDEVDDPHDRARRIHDGPSARPGLRAARDLHVPRAGEPSRAGHDDPRERRGAAQREPEHPHVRALGRSGQGTLAPRGAERRRREEGEIERGVQVDDVRRHARRPADRDAEVRDALDDVERREHQPAGRVPDDPRAEPVATRDEHHGRRGGARRGWRGGGAGGEERGDEGEGGQPLEI